MEIFLGKKTHLPNSWADEEHPPGGRCIKSQQSSKDFTRSNTEGLSQDKTTGKLQNQEDLVRVCQNRNSVQL